MKKKILIKNLEKILEKKNISEKSDLNDLGLDSLKILEIMAFNDLSFNSLKISADKISKCKIFGQLIKLYERKIT